jgi:hypothetical protein
MMTGHCLYANKMRARKEKMHKLYAGGTRMESVSWLSSIMDAGNKIFAFSVPVFERGNRPEKQ